MAVATFDTLKFAKTLRASGVPDLQAEAQAEAMAEIIKINFENLVTTDDLLNANDSLQQKLFARMDLFEHKYRSEQLILKTMLGLLITVCISIFVRLFFFKGAL